ASSESQALSLHDALPISDVHRQGHGDPDPHSWPVDRRDHRLAAGGDLQRHGAATIAGNPVDFSRFRPLRAPVDTGVEGVRPGAQIRKSTRLNSSHVKISY